MVIGHTVLIVLRPTFDLPWTSLVPLEERCTRLYWRINQRKMSNNEGTNDIRVENDLLHYMSVIRQQEVDSVLKVVIKIYRIE